MRPWMLQAPDHALTASDLAAFAAAWAARDLHQLPEGLPRWLFLQWLTEQGYLLHGSQQPEIARFEPRTPVDRSPDDFSKRTGVFAASDGLWVMMSALRHRMRVQRMLNMALRLKTDVDWSPTQSFLSFVPREWGGTDPRELLAPGVVYVLPADGFEQMPPYDWPGLGRVPGAALGGSAGSGAAVERARDACRLPAVRPPARRGAGGRAGPGRSLGLSLAATLS